MFRWRKKDIPQGQLNFIGENEKLDGLVSALDYFKLFWTDDLKNLIVDNTNLCSTEKTGKSINATKMDMEKFIGMHMKMGIINLPSHILYWSNEMQ